MKVNPEWKLRRILSLIHPPFPSPFHSTMTFSQSLECPESYRAIRLDQESIACRDEDTDMSKIDTIRDPDPTRALSDRVVHGKRRALGVSSTQKGPANDTPL